MTVPKVEILSEQQLDPAVQEAFGRADTLERNAAAGSIKPGEYSALVNELEVIKRSDSGKTEVVKSIDDRLNLLRERVEGVEGVRSDVIV